MVVTNKQFEREKNFRVALCIAKSMQEREIITGREYCKINTMIIGKYGSTIGSLCS